MNKVYNPNGMKLCINCKYHSEVPGAITCKAPQLKLPEDSIGVTASLMRERFDNIFQEDRAERIVIDIGQPLCGRKGTWFVAND